MTAGRGIIHNEEPPAGVTVHSLQLWINLPAADKMAEARTQNLVAADLPLRREQDAEIGQASIDYREGRFEPRAR